jgi:hypothetical protein
MKMMMVMILFGLLQQEDEDDSPLGYSADILAVGRRFSGAYCVMHPLSRRCRTKDGGSAHLRNVGLLHGAISHKVIIFILAVTTLGKWSLLMIQLSYKRLAKEGTHILSQFRTSEIEQFY